MPEAHRCAPAAATKHGLPAALTGNLSNPKNKAPCLLCYVKILSRYAFSRTTAACMHKHVLTKPPNYHQCEGLMVRAVTAQPRQEQHAKRAEVSHSMHVVAGSETNCPATTKELCGHISLQRMHIVREAHQ